MTFKFEEKLGIRHRFSTERRSAGDDWFQAFLRRIKELSIRKSEGLSVARAKGMNRTDVENFLPRKGEGKAVLILDGHRSHCNAIELLETASKNDVAL